MIRDDGKLAQEFLKSAVTSIRDDDKLAQEFLKSVVTSIRDDEIGLIAKNDKIILSLGLEYYKERYTQ